MDAAVTEPVQTARSTSAVLDDQLQRARDAQLAWARLSVGSRARRLQQLARRLRAQAADLATLIHQDMGKLAAEAQAEVARSANWLDHLAQHGEDWLMCTGQPSTQRWRDPQGTVLAVTPWNYPLWQLCRPLAPALLAGNAIVFKPSPGGLRTARWLLAQCQTLFPAGLISDLSTADALAISALQHPLTDMLVLTGSEHAGRSLAAIAGQALKPAVLELGGNNPFLVLDDADIDAAVLAAAQSRCMNAGQSCTAAKRMIVAAPVAERFQHALIQAMRSYRCGDNLAPLARADLFDRAQQQVAQSVQLGSRVLLGGETSALPGPYFPPTVLDHVEPHHPAFADEVFAPLATVSIAHDEDSMVKLANAVRQRLVASIWTRDSQRARQLARRLGIGLICHNQRPASQLDLPFEGRGASGYGSTLGREGLLAFTRPGILLSPL